VVLEPGTRNIASEMYKCAKHHIIVSFTLIQLLILHFTDGEAFVDLHSVVERLVTLGMSQAWGREQEVCLSSSKQYLTGDYKVIYHN